MRVVNRHVLVRICIVGEIGERRRVDVEKSGVAVADDGEGFVEISWEGCADVVDGWELDFGEITDLLGGDDGFGVLGADTMHEDIVEKVLDDVAVVVDEALIVDAEIVWGSGGPDWVSGGNKRLRVVNSQKSFGDALEIYHPVLRRTWIIELTACLIAAEHDIGGVDIGDRGAIKIFQCLIVHPSSECLDRCVNATESQVFVEDVGTLFI